jgi:molecular chaperone DnaK
MSVILGIDKGNTNLRSSTLDTAGNPIVIAGPTGEMMIRSVVYLGDEGPVVGLEAYNQLLADPSRGVQNWKRFMGQDKILVSFQGKDYRAHDIGKLLLESILKNFQNKTGQVPTDVAISVPANYNQEQRQRVLEAAEIVGLPVVCLPSEPAAALLGNGVHKRGDGLYLVIDVGGSTTDVSVGRVTGKALVIEYTDGEPQVGGQDYNAAIERLVLEQFRQKFNVAFDTQKDVLAYQDLVHRIEQAKLTLSVKEKASIVVASGGKVLNFPLLRKDFEKATAIPTAKILDCTEATLKAAGVKSDQLSGILLVGGPSKMPALIDGIEKRFGRKPSAQCEPHFATALGCAIAARLEVEKQGRSVQVGETTLPPLKLSLREVTGHAIGVCTLRDQVELVNSVIVPKGTPIPFTLTRPFKLTESGQTDALIEVLQGDDGARQDQCLQLGHFKVEGMTAVTDDVHRIDLELSIDKNNMLTATAYDPLSGIRTNLVIDYKNSPKAA